MSASLKLEDFKRGTVVAFEWAPGPAGDLARKRNLRALGKVVTREDLPKMSSTTTVGVQLLDDPLWVIDPAFAMSKGKSFTLALHS